MRSRTRERSRLAASGSTLELSLVKPSVVVALGATAAQALLSGKFRVTKERGKVIDAAVGRVIATVHPSSILRAPNDAARENEMKAFIRDLRAVARALARHDHGVRGPARATVRPRIDGRRGVP